MVRVAVPSMRWSVLAGAGFLGVLGMVVGRWGTLERADAGLSGACRAYGEQHPHLVAALRVATDVMQTPVFMGLGVAAALLFVWRRDWRAAGFVAAVTALVPALWGIPHAVLYRPRPVDAFVTTASNGFPSGHTTNATAAALALVLLGWHRWGRAGRGGTVAVAAVFAAFIGATRIALLAHWPSDVVAGWLLAVAVVPLLARAAGYPPAAAAAGDGLAGAGRGPHRAGPPGVPR